MTSSPRGVDVFDLESLLSVEELQIRDAVRAFAVGEAAPLVREHWRLGSFPVALIRRMGELGVLGGHLDHPDSPHISPLAMGLTMLELERVDAGLRSFASIQGCLVMGAILRYGTDEQRKHWLPRLARGEAVGAFAMTEPDHGSDPSNMTTRAAVSGDYYVIHGSKSWITNGSLADVVVVWARCDEGLGAFLVERGLRGLSAVDIPGKHAMRMSVTSELSFDECAVPSSARLPGATSLRDCLKLLNEARYAIAWGAAGAAEACFEEALGYVRSRVEFNKPLASFQLVQEKLANAAAAVTRSQLFAYHLARLKATDHIHHLQVSMAKRENLRSALETARICRDLLGASGISDEYGTFRHMANLEAQSTIEGTDHIHALIVGHCLTGFAAYE